MENESLDSISAAEHSVRTLKLDRETLSFAAHERAKPRQAFLLSRRLRQACTLNGEPTQIKLSVRTATGSATIV
jgi:hypothetical protein